MLKEGLARALIEEILRPDDTFDSNNTLHQNAIRDYMFQKENTPGVNSHIKIETFEREMRKIKMDINDSSWVSRTMTFLNKITLLLEDTRVKMTDKKLVKLCMRSVEPYRLRKRMYGLIESGCEDDKAAGKNIQVWKTMLRRETRLDWESEFRLRGVSTDARRGGFQNSKGRGIRRFNGRSITRPPNNVRIKSCPVNFRKNPPPPTALTRQNLRALTNPDDRIKGRQSDMATRTTRGRSREDLRTVHRQRLVSLPSDVTTATSWGIMPEIAERQSEDLINEQIPNQVITIRRGTRGQEIIEHKKLQGRQLSPPLLQSSL